MAIDSGSLAGAARAEQSWGRLRILARAFLLGLLWGAVLGVAVLTVISLLSWLPAVLFAPVAATVGAVIGGLDGAIAGVVLALSWTVVRGQKTKARLISAAAAAGPPLVLMTEPGGPWQWWLVVAVLAAAAGAVLGPRVVDGRPKRAPSNKRPGNETRPCAVGHLAYRHPA